MTVLPPSAAHGPIFEALVAILQRNLTGLELDDDARDLVGRRLEQMADSTPVTRENEQTLSEALVTFETRLIGQVERLVAQGVEVVTNQQAIEAMNAMCSIPPLCER